MKYDPCLHVVLYQPEIPHNAGAVGRTCAATGAKLWLVRPLGFRIDDYHLRRAGLDYWEHLEWEAVDDWEHLKTRLPPDEDGRARLLPSRDAADRMWLFTKKAEQDYLDARFRRGDVLVFGSESAGLPDELLARHRDRTLRIPIRPEVRSLNVSNAVAVAVYEALRQTGTQGA